MSKQWRFLGADLETFWSQEYTLSKMSSVAYVRHKLFKAHGASIKVGSKPARWLSEKYLSTFFSRIDPSETILYGHNLSFDADILAHHYGFVPARYVDTLSLARALIGNRLRNRGLDHVCTYFGIEGKLDGGRALVNTRGIRYLTPEQERALAEYAVVDIEKTWDILRIMTPMFPKGELPVQDWCTRMVTQPRIMLDEAVLQKVYDEEVARKTQVVLDLSKTPELQKPVQERVAQCGRQLTDEETYDLVSTQLRSNDKLAQLLRDAGVEPPKKFSKTAKDKDGKPKITYAFAKTDQQFVELQECADPKVAGLVRGRLGVKSSIEETRALAFLNLAKLGLPVPVPLNYSGAHTHRLSGGARLNWQNLGRKSPIKQGIVAPPGYVFVDADSSQIELRTSSALAGEQGVLDALASGRDLYSEFGARIGVVRQVAKIAVLQLGYQAGWQRFQHSVWTETMKLGTPVYLTDEEAKRIVYGYRDTFGKQKALWAECGVKLKEMSNGIEPTNLLTNPPLTWYTDAIVLPSGLALQYPELADVENEEDGRREFRYGDDPEGTKIYGGMVVENLSQALAREIIIYQKKKINPRYFVSLQIHDSVMTVVPEEEVEECADFIYDTMSTRVQWWDSVPLACEVKAGRTLASLKTVRKAQGGQMVRSAWQ